MSFSRSITARSGASAIAILAADSNIPAAANAIFAVALGSVTDPVGVSVSGHYDSSTGDGGCSVDVRKIVFDEVPAPQPTIVQQADPAPQPIVAEADGAQLDLAIEPVVEQTQVAEDDTEL